MLNQITSELWQTHISQNCTCISKNACDFGCYFGRWCMKESRLPWVLLCCCWLIFSFSHRGSSFVLKPIFSSAICYCAGELLSWRSSVHRRPSVPQTKEHKIWGNGTYYPPYLQTIFYLFFRILFIFILFYCTFHDLCFVIINMGPYGRKNFKRHLIWKCTTDICSESTEQIIPVVRIT